MMHVCRLQLPAQQAQATAAMSQHSVPHRPTCAPVPYPPPLAMNSLGLPFPLFVPPSSPVGMKSAGSPVSGSPRPSSPSNRRTRRRIRVHICNPPKPPSSSFEISLPSLRPAEIVGKAYKCPSTAAFTVSADIAESFIGAMPHGHGHALLACAVHVVVDLLLASPY